MSIDIVSKILKKKNLIECEIFKFNPSQYDNSSLYGYYDSQYLEWVQGILSSKLATKIEASDQKQLWIIMDGVLESSWIETMNSLLDNNRKVILF